MKKYVSLIIAISVVWNNITPKDVIADYHMME